MSDALVQALMLSQRQRSNPIDRRRAFGEEILKQGSSTAPVYSPLEGLARALQGGVGGYFAGAAEREQTEKNRKGIEGLSAALSANDPASRAAALKGLDADNEYTAPLLGQMLTQQVADERAQARLTQGSGQLAAGYGVQAQPQGVAQMPQAGGVNPNNIGNVRPVGGGPNSGFQQPPTLEDGVRLAVNNVRAYPAKFNNGQPMTLTQIGQRWAPAGDGANDPNQWARNVASIGGLDPNQPLDLNNPQVAAAFARGVHGAEHGQKNIRPPEYYAQVLVGGGPQVAQGAADGSGTPTQPSAPQVPDVPRPQPSPQQLAKHQQILQQGGYGQGPDAVAKARAAIEQELDRDWQVARDTAGKRYSQQQEDFNYTRKRSDEASGKQFDQEGQLRDKFAAEPPVKSFRAVVPMLEAARKAGASRAGDLNLVYAFAKMMDPDSVVRESETAGVVATASVADRLQAYIGQLNGQPMLNPDVRAKLMKELETRYQALQTSHDELKNQYGQIATSYGLTPERVTLGVRSQQAQPGAQQPGQAPGQATPQAAPQQQGQPQTIASDADYDALPPGATFVGPDGKTRRKP